MESTPNVENFLQWQIEIQEAVMKRLQKLREVSNKNSNKGRTDSKYFVSDFVLVHRNRWPQKKIDENRKPMAGPLQNFGGKAQFAEGRSFSKYGR